MATPTEEIAQDPADEVEGFVDEIVNDYLHGWVWRPRSPSDRISVKVAVDRYACDPIVADRLNPELANAGIGDGRYGFSLPLPHGFLDGGYHQLLVTADGQPLTPRQPAYEASHGTRFVVVPSFSSELAAATQAARMGGIVFLGAGQARRTRVDGLLEAVVGDELTGWAWLPDEPEARATIEVRLDGEKIGETVAADAREDLERAGIGDGAHGFSFHLPQTAGREQPQLIEVRAGPARIPLAPARGYRSATSDSPRQLRPARYTAIPGPPPPPPEAALQGSQEWLFPVYGPADTTLSARQVEVAVERYADIWRTLSRLHIDYHLAIAPEKQDVYPQLAAGASSVHAQLARLLRVALRDSEVPEPIDLADPIRDARHHGLLYPRTDSKWNTRGAFFAAQAVVKEVAKRSGEARVLDPNAARGVIIEGFRGDLADLPRVDPDGNPVDADGLVETTIEADASTLRSIEMPVRAHLSMPGHPVARLFEIRGDHELPRLALMGGRMVDQLLPWFAEHSSRTAVFNGHEPPLEPLELEAPQALVHVVTAVELLWNLRQADGETGR